MSAKRRRQFTRPLGTEKYLSQAGVTLIGSVGRNTASGLQKTFIDRVVIKLESIGNSKNFSYALYRTVNKRVE